MAAGAPGGAVHPGAGRAEGPELSLDERAFSFGSGDLHIEGMLHEGEGTLAAVVLHPHPLYGGDMDNHVVLALRSAIAASGATTLRFNFRGVGRSDGSFDDGRGEADDARSAVRALSELRPGAGLVMAGYSFGALVAAGISRELGLRALVLVSPPVAFSPLPELPTGVPCLLITGEYDDVAPPERVCLHESPDAHVAVVPGAGHAWWPGVDGLVRELATFLRGVAEA